MQTEPAKEGEPPVIDQVAEKTPGENTARSLHKDTWADGLGDIWNGHVPREIYDCD